MKQASRSKNPYILEGKRFLVGIVDLVDGHVLETVNHERADAAEWRHRFYFSPLAVAKWDDGEAALFWPSKNGKLYLDSGRIPQSRGGEDIPRFIHDRLSSMIEVKP